LKGHGFSRAANIPQSTWASAPEGCISFITLEIQNFSAGYFAPSPSRRSTHDLSLSEDKIRIAPQTTSTSPGIDKCIGDDALIKITTDDKRVWQEERWVLC
jgi:hypothetical protein